MTICSPSTGNIALGLRPRAILPASGEQIVMLSSHKGNNCILSGRQHAFRERHSCETQLTTVINDWAKILDNKGQVDIFILDFEKAVDTPTLTNFLKANGLALELVERH